jgi:hypothetical protein
MSRHPNSGQNQNIRIADESFDNLVKFEFFWVTLTNQNDIHDEIKSRLSSGNAYFIRSNIFCLPISYTKESKDKIYKTVNFPSVFYVRETYSFTLREEHRPGVFGNRVLKKICGPKREEDGSLRKLHNEELHSLYSSANIILVMNSRRTRWA